MTMLTPYIYPSNGLLQAHFDARGGGLLETTVGGDTPPLIAVVQGQQITIPAENGGGAVTWIRAVWPVATAMRWDGYMADLDPASALPGDANLMASQQPDINNWSYGADAKFDITAVAGVVTVATPVSGGASVSSWDISTGSYASKSLSSGTQDAITNGIAFSADGTKMYVIGDTNNTIYQYTLSTPWDVSTGSYANKSFSVASQDSLPWGITFNGDGTKMYVSGETNAKVYQYSLSTAWDVSTASYATKSLLISGQDTKPRGIVFNGDGTTLMVAGYTNDTVFQYTLTTAWDLSTGSYASKSKWIGAESFVTGLAFKPDGLVMYTCGTNNSRLYQYLLATAWDLSTASYDNKSLLISGQDAVPTGLAIKGDGLSVYVAGQTNDTTYQYSLGTVPGGTGVGYAVGNIVPINGGGNNAYATVTAVDANGGITTVGSLVGGSGYTTGTNKTTHIAVNTATETRITLAQSTADGTAVQVFYTYRDGSTTDKGAAIGGWPNLHTCEAKSDYGTANDGDNYLAKSAYMIYRLIGIDACQSLADRIIAAQLAAGAGPGQYYTFDIPLEAEQDGGGLYYYNNDTTWAWQIKSLPDGSGLRGLNIQTVIEAGGPPYDSAGFGSWINWPVTADTPVASLSFDFYGDGSGNQLLLTTNIHDPSDTAGEYAYGFASLAADQNIKRTITVALANFWQLNNVVYNADRSSGRSYAAYSNDSLATLTTIEKDNTGASGYHRWKAARLTFYLATETYAGCYFSINAGTGFASTGTTNLKMDLESSFTGNIVVTIKDGADVNHAYTYAATAGSQLFNVAYTSFDGGAFTHPIKQVTLEPSVVVNGTLDIDNIRCAGATDIVTLAAASITMINGWEFSFVLGSYNVNFKNIEINQTAIDPYPLLSRWTYNFTKYLGGAYYGQGAWRGAQAPGYIWLAGYTLADVRYPAGTIARYVGGTTHDYSGETVSSCIRKFMQDAQNAYKTQYPAETKGPMMKKYGCWGWEHVGGSGYIGGVAVPNVTYPQGVLNEFYCEGSDDWYGYQYRAFLSIAEDYFISGDATSLAVLDNWISWVNTEFTWNAGTHAVTAPTTFNVDGTLANSSNIYADACTAAACIYKYWRDGDATALTWLNRCLEDLHYNHKITSVGALYGAYDTQHAGWESAEILCTLGMLLIDYSAIAPINHAITVPSWLEQDYVDLLYFYDANTGDSRPSMLTSELVPMHEYTLSSWHTSKGVTNPVNYDTTMSGSRDTHTDGNCWTETIGPTLLAAAQRYLYEGKRRWLQQTVSLVQAMSGITPFAVSFPATAQRLAAQAEHERKPALVLELDIDYCNNTFGVAPCTATGTKCYNTYGTCKDKPNYSRGMKTRKFCMQGMTPIPPGETLRPYISDYSFTPTQIPLIAGLGTRGQATITLKDEVCGDGGEDPYVATRSPEAQGTYWTRLMARNYNYSGRMARVRRGFVTDPFSWLTFQDELYIVTSITGPDQGDRVRITLADLVKPVDKNQVPVPTTGKITVDLKATEHTGLVMAATASTVKLDTEASAIDDAYAGQELYISIGVGSGQRRTIASYVGETRTLTLATALLVTPDTGSTVEVGRLSVNVGEGKGAQYNDPDSTGRVECVRIGDEVIRYTAISGDVLSWPDTTYRAQFSTAREDHDAGDGVQQCFVATDEAYSSVVQRLFNLAGIDDGYLDITGLQTEDMLWLGSAFLVTACLSSPSKASDPINSLLLVGRMQSWWDAVKQQQQFKCNMPRLEDTIAAITADETVRGTVNKEILDSLRITSLAVVYGLTSATANQGELKNYLYPELMADTSASGANEYNGIIMSKLFSQWLSDANSIYVRSFAARTLAQLRDAPVKLSFKLDPRNEVHMADLIDVTTRKHTDETGAPLPVRMEVTRLQDEGVLSVEAISTTFAKRYAFINASDCPVYTSASVAQKNRAFICDSAGLMSNGDAGFLLS